MPLPEAKRFSVTLDRASLKKLNHIALEWDMSEKEAFARLATEAIDRNMIEIFQKGLTASQAEKEEHF